jgi:hypothetical protein
MVEPSLALWPTLQKVPTKGCRSAGCNATSLSRMPRLHGNCLLCEAGSFRTADMVLKPVPFSHCQKKRVTLTLNYLVGGRCASFL